MVFAAGIVVAIVCSAAGDYFLKTAAAEIRTPSLASFGGYKGVLSPSSLYDFFRQSHIVGRRFVFSVFLLTLFFAGYLTALRAGDVTLVVPMMSMVQVLNTLIGKYLLGERITWLRWAGVIVIICGVIFLSVFTGQSGSGI